MPREESEQHRADNSQKQEHFSAKKTPLTAASSFPGEVKVLPWTHFAALWSRQRCGVAL